MMIGKLILKNSLLLALIISLFLIIYKKEKEIISTNNFKNLKSGDLIFRKELNFISNMFALVDNSEYSHIGIVFVEGDQIFVYHIESNEEDNDLKKDEINHFLSSSEKYRILRYKDNIDEKSLQNILKNIFQENIKFDFHFDLTTTDKLYCTEFVNNIFYKLINKNIYTYLYDFNGNLVISIKSILLNQDFIIVNQ